MASESTAARRRLPVPALFVSSGIFTYVGAAIAVGLFVLMPPTGVVWWRMALGAVVLLLLWRPWKQAWTPKAVLVAVVFGLVLGAMNALFYEAIARMPMGAAVSVEFIGPVIVAVVRGRGWTPRIAAVLALVGIFMIGGWGVDLSNPTVRTGFFFILGAAVAWACYISLGSYISRRRPTGPSLALGLSAATIIYLPVFFADAFHVDFTGNLVLMLIGVGVLSTALPYSIDAIAFGRISDATFALLTSLLPLTSVIVGAIMLRQIPNAFEISGMILVSVAVWLANRVPRRRRSAKGAVTATTPELVEPMSGVVSPVDVGESEVIEIGRPEKEKL